MNLSARILRRLAGPLLVLASLPVLAAAPACPTISVGPSSLPDAVIGTAYTQALTTSALAPNFSISSGVLPGGLAINLGQLAGTPTATGTFDFTISASDAASCSGSRIYRMAVMCGSFSIAAPPDAVVGTAYSQALAASGGATPYTFALDASSPLLPTGLTLTANGQLSGTPVAGSGGSYSLLIDVSDNASCTGAPVAVTLVVNEAAAITSASSTTFNVGSNGSFTVTATGYPAPTLSTASTLPSGVTFNTLTGVLSGTPAAGTGGSYPITFSANNTLGTTTQNFTLTVDEAPAFTSAAATTFVAGTASSFTITTSSGWPSALTLSESGALPAGVSFVDNGDGTATLAGTPTAGSGGVHSLVFSANNGGAPVTQNFTLTVNEAPTITSANATAFALNAPSTFTVTATGYPAPTFSETGALPAGITFNTTSGVLSGTPTTSGSFSLTLTANNGIGAPATQAFTLAVTNPPAITSANAATFLVGTAGAFTVTTVGSPTPALSVSGTLPGGVAFVDNGDGTATLSGTPTAGSGGVYNLVISASNGVGAPVTQNFTLTVNEAPTITSANATAFALNAASTFTVTATGYPAPTFSETGALPAGITFNTTSGVLSGTPTTSGSFSLTLSASNGIGAPATQSFTLAVTEPPAFTSTNATTFVVGTAGSFSVTASGSPAPALSLASGALPGGVTFTPATGVLAGTPATGSGGVYNLVFSANNGVGAPATQNFTLTVNEAPAITSVPNATFLVGAAGTFSVTASGYPAPTLSLASGALPSGVTFTPAGGALAGTPGAGTGGSYALSFSASNGVGANATQAFTLIVNQPAVITSAAGATFTVGSAGSFSMSASGYPAPTLSLAGSLPSGVTFTPASGLLSGTPAAGTGGTYPLTLTATNSTGSPSQAFVLTVDEAPAITSGAAATFPIGTASSFSVTSTGFPTPALSKTGLLPFGVTFVDNSNGTATLAGTPGPGTAGTWPLQVTAANGVGSDAVQVLTLTVTCPVITVSGTLPDGLYQTAYGPQTFTQTGGFSTPVWSASGLPAGLVIGAADGKVSGTPTTTTNGVSVGITATDGNLCTGTLTINPFKVLPVAGNDSYTTFGNTQLYVSLPGPATPYVGSGTAITNNDSGPGTITPIVAGAPAHGALSSFGSGAFVYTPTAGYTGADAFTYTITDGNGVVSAPATVSITLGQVVWYVNGAGAAGDGSSATPFNSLANASTAHAAGSMVFVESGATATTTPGAITLKANTTLWGQGVALQLAIANTGATSKPKLTGTVTLGGNGDTVSSLDINSAAAIGLNNTGTLTGATVQNDVTVATTTAAAVNLSNVTASTLTFRRIDAGTAASGPVNGIVLNTTSPLTVLGDGTTNTCRSGNTACSGGTIQHTSGDGISLTASGATLSSMWIKSNANSGIKGQGVPKLALTDLLVQNNTNNTGEQAGLLINDLSDAAATATRIEVSGSTEDNVRIHNSSVTGAIVIDASTVIDNSTASGNQGVFFQSNATGHLTGTVKNSFLHGNRTIALRGDAGDSSILSATFTGNTITAGALNQGNQGIEVSRAVTSTLTFNVDSNNVSGLPSTLINVFSSGGPGAATGDVKNNIVSGVGVGGNQVGIRLFNSGDDTVGYATMNVNVAGNTVSAIDNAYAILGESSQPGTSVNTGGALKIAVTGNTANVAVGGAAAPLDAIRVQSRVKSSVCARISGNTSAGGGPTFYGLQVRQANTALFNLEGLAAGPQSDPTVINYLVSQNPAVATVGPTIGTITGIAANGCGITP